MKKSILFSLSLLAWLAVAEAAPRRNSHEEERMMWHEMRNAIEELRHIAHNHETEIRMYDEKLNNLDSIIDSLHKQLAEANKVNKDLLKEAKGNLEAKMGSLETSIKGLTADLRQFKTHANESATALAQDKQKLTELSKHLEAQNKNIQNLQLALRSLTEAMQVKIGDGEGGSRTYQVKTGDSLEKIAKAYQTTISALKAINNLKNDRIVVGQTLVIP